MTQGRNSNGGKSPWRSMVSRTYELIIGEAFVAIPQERIGIDKYEVILDKHGPSQ